MLAGGYDRLNLLLGRNMLFYFIIISIIIVILFTTTFLRQFSSSLALCLVHELVTTPPPHVIFRASRLTALPRSNLRSQVSRRARNGK